MGAERKKTTFSEGPKLLEFMLFLTMAEIIKDGLKFDRVDKLFSSYILP